MYINFIKAFNFDYFIKKIRFYARNLTHISYLHFIFLCRIYNSFYTISYHIYNKSYQNVVYI